MTHTRVLVFLLLTVAATAGGGIGEATKRLRRAYGPGGTATERSAAIAFVGDADCPEAAVILTDLWERLGRGLAKKRRELYQARSKARVLRKKRRQTPRKAGGTATQLDDLERKIVVLNDALAAAELEQANVVRALEGMKAPAVIAWMGAVGFDRTKSAALRTLFARKAAGSEAGPAVLLARLKTARRPEQAIPILRALAGRDAFDAGDALPVLIRFLTSSDWGVRVAAGHALAVAAEPASIPPLIRALTKEQKASRAQRELTRALTKLTGQNLGPYPDAWKKWWRDHEAAVFDGKVELGKGKLPADRKLDQGRFYGIPQEADRIIYVFDQSGSMDVSMLNPKFVEGGAVPAEDDEDSRYDAAKRELVSAMRRLRRSSRFALITYASHVTPFHDKLVDAGKDAALAVEVHLDQTGPAGSTNIYAALDFALRLANVHPDSKPGVAAADAIFLISDGSPTNSKGKTEDPERTLQAVREWNALQRVAIHTIGIGKSHSADFLRRLASENGGVYYAVLPKKHK